MLCNMLSFDTYVTVVSGELTPMDTKATAHVFMVLGSAEFPLLLCILCLVGHHALATHLGNYK